ncbi:MAG TPA: hypothetical protein VEO00_00070 [Actinomycetota bacterium]|nr:hypothetical protein [Actinomycetota bacterium]
MRGRIALAAVLCLAAGLIVGIGALPASAGANPTCDPEFTGTSGDDVIVGDGYDNHICGRAGNDKLFGLEGEDVLEGQDGNDQLFAGDDYDYDYLWGGRGRDRLVPGWDYNELNGGPGHDVADYSIGTEGCNVQAYLWDAYIDKCDGYYYDSIVFANDLSTVENVTGTPWEDYFEGDVQANRLVGGASGDEAHGRGGEDSLYGQLGDDLLLGEGGNDYLNGGDQSTVGDVCFGGAGTNTIVNCFP